MYEQVHSNVTEPDEIGSRIDPVLARSWLLVNGAHADRFKSAVHSRADIVVFDIEDAVAPKDKHAARDNVVRWLRPGNTDWVRINGFGTPWWADDLAALAGTPVGGVMLAMVESVDHVAETAKLLPDVLIVALVETARGLKGITEIAAAKGTFRLLRHRRLPSRHRFWRRPGHPGLHPITFHDRVEGGQPAQRDRRSHHRLQSAEADRGHGGLRRVWDDGKDLPCAGTMFRRQ